MPEQAPTDNRPENDRAEYDPSNANRPSPDRPSNDRRRTPRFICGGHAEIICLPSTGLIVPGTIRDLSLHGCRVETSLPIGCGARAEVVLRVNSGSFRALGEVKAIRGQSGSVVEFVRLSANGKDILTELVTDLARLQALMNKLKSDRRAVEAELFGRELEGGKLRPSSFRERFEFLRTILAAEEAERKIESAGADSIREERLVVPVDLFG